MDGEVNRLPVHRRIKGGNVTDLAASIVDANNLKMTA